MPDHGGAEASTVRVPRHLAEEVLNAAALSWRQLSRKNVKKLT